MAGITVLIIEDDTIQRELLATKLRQQGFTVVTATEGNEALCRLSSGPVPDLILLDMLIPSGDCDGWWFLEQRQRIPELAAVPVLLLTSLSVASKAWAASLGAAGLIHKPYEVDLLLAEIRRCLGRTTRLVLVIEDNTIQRQELAAVLRQQGFTVLTADNGNEALSYLSEGTIPVLILLDMLLPSGLGDGWWLLEQRPRFPALASVPVIITTALAIASREWAASLGAAGLLRKPFDETVLLGEIRRCLSDNDAQGTAPR